VLCCVVLCCVVLCCVVLCCVVLCCLRVTSLMCKRILHKIRASNDYVLFYEFMVGPMNFSLVLYRTKLSLRQRLKHTY